MLRKKIHFCIEMNNQIRIRFQFDWYSVIVRKTLSNFNCLYCLLNCDLCRALFFEIRYHISRLVKPNLAILTYGNQFIKTIRF